MYKLLRQILKELKEINEKLQAIESSKEQEIIISDQKVNIKAPEITLNGKTI